MNSRVLAVSLALALTGFSAQAQTQSNPNDSDVDNLFNGGSAAPTAPSSPQPAPQQAPQPAPASPTSTPASPTNAPASSANTPPPALRPDDILQDRKLHFFGGLDLYGDVGAGWSQMPDPSHLGNNLGRDLGGTFTTNLGFEIRPASELRIRGKLSYTFPGSGFSAMPALSEMFFDYSVLETVFFRVGIFDYTWGNSQFFLYGNLPLRALPEWSGVNNLPFWEKNNLLTTITTQNYPVSFKMSIPMGFNTLTFLARFDLLNYGNNPNPLSPSPKNAGYGLQYDLVTGPVEWTVGGFYQWQLTPRSLLSMKTSLLGFDLSAETTVAFPVKISPSGFAPYSTPGGGIPVGGSLQRIYPTAVVGVSRDWPDAGVRVYAEYGYNGERDPGNPGTNWLVDETGPGGHNTAVGARFTNLGTSGLTLNLLWQQNWSDGSGLIAPFIQFSPVGLTTLQIGLPVQYGPSVSEVGSNRLAPGTQAVELLILVRVSSSFQQ